TGDALADSALTVLAVESKQLRILVRPAQTDVTDNPGSDRAERDPVGTVTQSVERLRAPGHGTDVGKSVARLAECAGPHERRFARDGRKPALQSLLEPLRPPGHEPVTPRLV